MRYFSIAALLLLSGCYGPHYADGSGGYAYPVTNYGYPGYSTGPGAVYGYGDGYIYAGQVYARYGLAAGYLGPVYSNYGPKYGAGAALQPYMPARPDVQPHAAAPVTPQPNNCGTPDEPKPCHR